MEVILKQAGNRRVAVIQSDEVLLYDAQDALDFMMNMHVEHETRTLVMEKQHFAPAFFDLSTRIAGEILQKFVNYRIQLAIVGDFSDASKSLRDFIYECNNGQDICFVPTVEEALKKFGFA